MRIFIILLFFFSNLSAQETVYTIKKFDNTEFKAKSYYKTTKKLKFTTLDDQKLEMPYNELKNITYIDKKNKKSEPELVKLEFINVSENNGFLMKVLKEGKCDLYLHSFDYLQYFVMREGEKIATPIYLKQIISNNFKKTALEYFKDCKEVTDRIKSKVFRKKNLEEMIDFYNSNCH